MKMQKWLNARCAQLLTEINNTPNTDDADDKKLQLIIAAMRESSIEMFHRAAENSRKEIQKINSQAMQESIDDVNASLEVLESETKPEVKPEVKPEAQSGQKIKLSSSMIRRVDSF